MQTEITWKRIALGITLSLCSLAAYAVSSPSIQLDQSKDIYFDQFAPYTYAQQILQAKGKFNNHDLILGGSLQTDWQHWHGNSITTTPASDYQQGQALYFTQGTIDIMGNVTPWWTSFLSIDDAHIGQPAPDGNDIYLNHAMFIFGNLDRFPLFVTTGINTIPFGVFTGTGVWDTPLTASYFFPLQSPLFSIGYFRNGLNISVSEFSDQANHANHSVFSLYYSYKNGKFSANIGAGYLTNLQSNETGSMTTHAKRRRDIPAGLTFGNVSDFNGGIGYGPVQLSLEYIKGSENTGSNTSVPAAASVLITYTHAIAGRDATFGFSRSQSFHLANVPTSLAGQDSLPLASDGLQKAWAVSASRTFFKDNISLGVDFAQTETYQAANSYAATVELFLYL